MSNTRTQISFYGVLGVAGAILFIAGILAVLIIPDMKSEARASWVQAVGSIGAILGAFAISQLQMRSDRENAERHALSEATRLKAVVKAVVDDLYQQILDVRHYFVASPSGGRPAGLFWLSIDYDRERYESALRRINSVPVFDLDSGDLAKQILRFQDASARIANWINYYESQRKKMGIENVEFDEPVEDHAQFMGKEEIEKATTAYTMICRMTGGPILTERRQFRGRFDATAD